MEDVGKITGICVTRADRLGLLSRAIKSFQDQSYPHKTLMIVAENAEHGSRIVEMKKDFPSYTRTLDPIDATTLLDRYSRALTDCGNARFFTFWDDDDESHPDRLARQVADCDVGSPSFLSGSLWHYHDSQELFVIDFEERFQPLWERVARNSGVFAVADLEGVNIPHALKQNPNPGVGLAKVLFDRANNGNNVGRATGEWWWMKTGVRGDNLQDPENHRALISEVKRCFSVKALKSRRVWLDSLLAGYEWDKPVDVCGHDGVAYTYSPVTFRTNMPPIGEAPGIEKVEEET